jgi:hypothetical protein
MGWLGSLFGGGSSGNNNSEGRRCAKDGTCFRDAKDRGHVVIERRGGGKPSVGHSRGSKGKK